LWQTIADIIELIVTSRYTRPMVPSEIEEQVARNKRSVRANDRLLKLLESQDADGAERYWTKHMVAVSTSLLAADGHAVIDLPD
jgi:hypothetical protein